MSQASPVPIAAAVLAEARRKRKRITRISQAFGIGAPSLGDVGMPKGKNSQTAPIGTGAACLGQPLRVACWLERSMVERGRDLKAGEVTMSGALGPMVPVAAGDLVQANLGALGQVSCRIV